MGKTLVGIAITILVTGFIAGLFSGIAFQTGVGVDEGSIGLLILSTFCESMENIEGANVFSYCSSTIWIITIVLFVIGIVEILGTAALIDDWRIGLMIYVIGWFIGFGYLLVN